jgi:hypothetical protein
MAGNTVTITLAGESKPAEDAFKRVGDAGDNMSKKVEASGEAFDRSTESADAAEQKAMGFRDTLTGIQDGAKGIKLAASGDWGFETLLLLGTGVGDLASGFANFLIPATKGMRTAQLGLNTAFLTSPITWIILGILVLIGIIILISKKTDWFSQAWKVAWGWIKDAASNAWDFIKKIPGWIGTAFGKIADLITWPFRTAFNFIADAWNNTIGRLSFTFPGWIPGIGGNTISVPNIPKFHSGGTVPGAPGSEMLAMVQAGEKIRPANSNGGDAVAVTVILDGEVLMRAVGSAIQNNGGNAQIVLVGKPA